MGELDINRNQKKRIKIAEKGNTGEKIKIEIGFETIKL